MVNNNADDYAAARQGIFFPANNSTPNDGNLTGQCVTLVKWFFAEMCTNFPNPFAARGDARYVGKNLVAQGLAVQIPAGQQKRGDVVCYEYGTYGHIGILLSGNRLFNENAQVAGATKRVLSDGTVVWSSTIVNLFASLGGVAPTFYRLNSYNEIGEDMPIPNTDDYYQRYRKAMIYIRGRDMTRDEFNTNFVGSTDLRMLEAMLDNPEADIAHTWMQTGEVAVNDHWQQQISDLQASKTDLQNQIIALKAQLAAQPDNTLDLTKQIAAKQAELDQVNTNLTQVQKDNDALKAQLAAQSGDTELLNGFGQWLQKLIARLGTKSS